MPSRPVAAVARSRWFRVVLRALALSLCVKGLYDVGHAHARFELPQLGVYALPDTELAYFAWYGLLGALALCAAVPLLRDLRVDARLREVGVRVAVSPRAFVVALSLLCFGASLLFKRFVLQDQPIADDESTYLFIARTLLLGRIRNPPPADPAFFHNPFVVLNDHAWYGKYPIGHPLWLALGEALHVPELMGPLAGALCVALTYAVATRLFSRGTALLAAALLLASPHFVWTCATMLSQPTSCLVMLVGCLWLLGAAQRPSVAWSIAAGLAFGFGCLVRPLPGCLFAAVAGAVCLGRVLSAAPGAARRGALAQLVAFALPSGVLALGLFAENLMQTGSALVSGYHRAHGVVTLFDNGKGSDTGRIAISVSAALLRENFWLFGVPCSLLPVVWGRPQRERGLVFGLIAAELAYRVISPKTVVSTTGPVYMLEIVPLLCMLAADGLLRLAGVWAQLRSGSAPGPASMALGAMLVAALMFLPVVGKAAWRAGDQRGIVFRVLERAGAERALVFADALVYPQSGLSWAYYPDNPSPALDDDVLFVRVPQPDTLARAQAFWRRRFPDRRAFFLLWSAKGEPVFKELGRAQ